MYALSVRTSIQLNKTNKVDKGRCGVKYIYVKNIVFNNRHEMSLSLNDLITKLNKI